MHQVEMHVVMVHQYLHAFFFLNLQIDQNSEHFLVLKVFIKLFTESI